MNAWKSGINADASAPDDVSAGGVTLSIRPVRGWRERRLFATLPRLLGGRSAGWSVPLPIDTARLFDPSYNGALAHLTVERWLAFHGARAVGRIAACWQGGGGEIGSFGFLALERDGALLAALLDAARAWLRARGAARIRGPLSFTINHEVGAQIAGFDAPGSLRTPRTPPWLPAMLDSVGLLAEQDIHACVLCVAEERHRARFAPLLARWPQRDELRIRTADHARWPDEVGQLTTIFNDAWAENWGFCPVSDAEAATIARLMRPIARAGQILFAEWRGEAIGALVLLPNLEEALERLNGRLLPFGWWHLLRALRPGGVTSARVPMLGIRRAWRGTAVSAYATGALLSEAIAEAERRGWARLEISWILGSNPAMLNTMAALPAPVERSWRIWGAPLD